MFKSYKIWIKRILAPLIFSSEKNLGVKNFQNILVPKKFLVKKSFVDKNSRSKLNWTQTNFGPKLLWVQKFLVKKFESRKILGPKKSFWSKIYLS